MKRIICIFTFISMLFILVSCTGYEYVQTEDFGIGYSADENKAFVADYVYDMSKSSTDIVIPEEYNGTKITKLGGYCGLGVPTPFEVYFIPESFPDYESADSIMSYSTDMISEEDVEVIYIDFTVYISKNIEEITYIFLQSCEVIEYSTGCESCETSENAQPRTVAYIPRFYINCDEANSVFYSRNGRLFNRADDTVIEDINYFDFTLN